METPAADPLTLAETLLDEVVFASRARQSATTAVSSGDPACGLGAAPKFEAQFGARARQCLEQLWPEGAPDDGALQATLSAWVRRQDGFDRERNHFLKAFRAEHGFDRSAYAPDVRNRFEEGLDAINQMNAKARRTAAQALLAARG